MKTKSFALRPLYFLLLLPIALSGCLNAIKDDASFGPYGLHGYSAFYYQSGKLRQMPPLHERGVDSLVFVYQSRENVVLRSFSRLFVHQRSSEVDGALIIPEGFVEERLMAEASAAAIETRLATADEAKLLDHITIAPGSGEREFDETGQAILTQLKAEGVDTVLLAQEPEELTNFLYQTGLLGALVTRFPPKGLVYRPREGAYAVAAFDFVLIDTASSKEVPDSSFTQASSEPLNLRWQHFFDVYPPGEQSVVRGALLNRLTNNVRAMLQLVKVIPGEDGTYLTYDPEEAKIIQLDYPE